MVRSDGMTRARIAERDTILRAGGLGWPPGRCCVESAAFHVIDTHEVGWVRVAPPRDWVQGGKLFDGATEPPVFRDTLRLPVPGRTEFVSRMPAVTERCTLYTSEWPPGIVRRMPEPLPPLDWEYPYVEQLPEMITDGGSQHLHSPPGASVDGTVLVLVWVGIDGTVRSTKIKESIPALDSAAVEWVRSHRFRPARSAGRAVSVWVAVPVRFYLP
jgi:TonB family protein